MVSATRSTNVSRIRSGSDSGEVLGGGTASILRRYYLAMVATSVNSLVTLLAAAQGLDKKRLRAPRSRSWPHTRVFVAGQTAHSRYPGGRVRRLHHYIINRTRVPKILL